MAVMVLVVVALQEVCDGVRRAGHRRAAAAGRAVAVAVVVIVVGVVSPPAHHRAAPLAGRRSRCMLIRSGLVGRLDVVLRADGAVQHLFDRRVLFVGSGGGHLADARAAAARALVLKLGGLGALGQGCGGKGASDHRTDA